MGLITEKREKTVAFFALFTYTWIVFVLQTIKNYRNITLLFTIFLAVFSFVVTLFAFRVLSKFTDISFNNPNLSRRESIIGWICIFLITFAFYMLYFGAQYPGGFSPDTSAQYAQAINGNYTNWHPALHTFLFFTIPLSTGHKLGLMVFLQLLYFCLAFSYLVYVLYCNGCPKMLVCIICVYVWINPFLATYFMYPWKDIALTIFSVLLVAYYIQIIVSKGGVASEKT